MKYEVEDSWVYYLCYLNIWLYFNNGNMWMGKFLDSRLELMILDRGSLEAMNTGVVLGRLVLLCKFNQKIIDLVA